MRKKKEAKPHIKSIKVVCRFNVKEMNWLLEIAARRYNGCLSKAIRGELFKNKTARES